MAKQLSYQGSIWSMEGDDGFATVIINGKQYDMDCTHPSFKKVIEELKLKTPNPNRLKSLMSVKTMVKSFSDGSITIVGEKVLKDGVELHGNLVDMILTLHRSGHSFERFLKFLDNLMLNPSKRAVDELYNFLAYVRLPITEDGCFIGYKKVQDDYLDCYSKQFDNSPGKVHEIPRNTVDDDKTRTCSYGFHVGSLDYAKNQYMSDSGRVMLVKVNPKDVVSVPVDYDGQKLRTCKYEVLSDCVE
jgi:hypothetical protein